MLMTRTMVILRVFVAISLLFLFQLPCIVAVAENTQGSHSSTRTGAGGQILARVADHLDYFMNAPVDAIRRAQRYSNAGGFGDGPSFQIFHYDSILKWLWMELSLHVYFGLEDGEFLIYIDPTASTVPNLGFQYRRPGFSGYTTNPVVPEESLAHWNACIDSQGKPVNCTLQEGSLYVKCADDCSLKECETQQSDCDRLLSFEERTACKEIKWCQQYSIETVQQGETNLGMVPLLYSCVDHLGAPNVNPGKVLVGDSLDNSEAGNCYYMDGTTVLNQTLGDDDYSLLCDYEEEQQQCNQDQQQIVPFHTENYDPRYRPWYSQSRAAQRPVWSDPYAFFDQHQIGITYTEPIYIMDGPKKIFAGVFAVDYTLENIRQFLLQFKGSGFMVGVIEGDEPNYVVAASTGSHVSYLVYTNDPTKPCQEEHTDAADLCTVVRIPIADMNEHPSEDVVLRRGFQAQLAAGFPTNDLVPFKESEELGSKAYFSQTKLFEQANANLMWHILVTVPMERSGTDAATVGTAAFYMILTIAIAGCIFCTTLCSLFIRLRKHKTIQNADWRFTSAFLGGLALWNLSCLTLLGENRDGLCMLRMWSINLCLVIAFSPLYVKVWRMHKLIHASSNFRRVSVTNFQAMLYTLPLILVEVILLTIFSLVDPSRSVEELGETFAQTQSVTCQHETNAFQITQSIFHMVLILIGCYLAYETRDLDPRFGEAKQLAFALYNTGLTGIIWILIESFVNLDKTYYLNIVETICVAWVSMFNSGAFVLPRLLGVHHERQKLRKTKSIHSGKKFVKAHDNEEVLVESSKALGITSSTIATTHNRPDSIGKSNIETYGDETNGELNGEEEEEGNLQADNARVDELDSESESSHEMRNNDGSTKRRNNVSRDNGKEHLNADSITLPVLDLNREEEIAFVY